MDRECWSRHPQRDRLMAYMQGPGHQKENSNAVLSNSEEQIRSYLAGRHLHLTGVFSGMSFDLSGTSYG